MKIVVRFILIACMAGFFTDAKAAEEKSNGPDESGAVDTQQPADVYCTQLEILFKEDNPFQPNTRFVDVPARYSEWYITLFRGGSGDQPLKFKVRKAGVVTLADFPARAKKLLREEGWTEVGRFAVYNTSKEKSLTYIIMEKHLEEGTYLFEAAGNVFKRPPLLIRKS
jgi:hypothetical protein